MIRNPTISKFKLTDAKCGTFEIIGVIAMFAILFLFVGGRRLRDFPITFNAIIQSTVAFHAIDGVTKVVEIAGNTQVNPTSVSGTGGEYVIYRWFAINNNKSVQL